MYKFSKTVQLQFEEIVFLHTLHERTQNPDDLELDSYFKWYVSRFQYFNRNGDTETPIRWVDAIHKLIKDGYINDLRTEEEKEVGKINISKFSVTEKFTKNLLMSDGKEVWWDIYYNDIWKPAAQTLGLAEIPVVSGTSFFILKPDNGNPKMDTIEKIKDVFWDEFCLRGQKDAINEFFSNTQKYLDENGANMKICRFFSIYKEMFKKK